MKVIGYMVNSAAEHLNVVQIKQLSLAKMPNNYHNMFNRTSLNVNSLFCYRMSMLLSFAILCHCL